LSLKATDEALLGIVDLFCMKYSFRELRSRKILYKHEKLWKEVVVCLCLNIDSQSWLGQYDRMYESMGFLEWVMQHSNIESYAFKKCVHILIEQPGKLLERYFEADDELKRFAQLYFDHLVKLPPKES